MSKIPLTAKDAWQWIVSGWVSFAKNPLMWVAVALLYIVSLFVLNLVPKVGALIAALLTPALLAGLLHGVREVEAGRELAPKHLFQAFQDQSKLLQLILLGLVPLAMTLLQKVAMVSAIPQGLAALTGLLLSLVSACTLLYGLPLIVIGNKQAIVAVPASLRACLAQPVAVGVFLALALLLMILALIPLGLGVLVYLPIMVGAMYASYRQVI